MDYKEINDYELLYMICDNDDSFEMLLEKYKPLINRKLLRYTEQAKKNGIDLDDLRQEIYLSVVSAIRNYDENSDASFYTYLNILIERKIANYWREYFSSKQYATINAISLSTPINENLTVEDVILDKDAYVEDITVHKILMEEIYRFCYDLSLRDAYIFEMFINGYSREVISDVLDIPYKKTAYLLDRIRNKLKIYLSKNDLLVV